MCAHRLLMSMSVCVCVNGCCCSLQVLPTSADDGLVEFVNSQPLSKVGGLDDSWQGQASTRMGVNSQATCDE